MKKCDWCGVETPFSELHDITTCGDQWTICTCCKSKVKTDAEINVERAKETCGHADPVKLRYMNWKGETRIREVRIIYILFAATAHHPTPQWLLRVYDLEKKDLRYFALKDCDFLTPTMKHEETFYR